MILKQLMIKRIKENVWQLCFKSFGSCAYILKINNKIILIDTSTKDNMPELLKDLEELNIKSGQVNIILLTHNHWDHTGNIDIFENAKIYGDKKDFKDEEILDLDYLKMKEIEIIKTPGHTKGGVCFLYEEILFSGDIIFHDGIGRMDLPGGSETQMKKSLKKLQTINYKILCPGHV